MVCPRGAAFYRPPTFAVHVPRQSTAALLNDQDVDRLRKLSNDLDDIDYQDIVIYPMFSRVRMIYIIYMIYITYMTNMT